MGANQDFGQGGNPAAPCSYGRASQREVGRAQEMGNLSGSYHHFPGVRQQNQTSRVEWKGLGKKQCQSSGSEIELYHLRHMTHSLSLNIFSICRTGARSSRVALSW